MAFLTTLDSAILRIDFLAPGTQDIILDLVNKSDPRRYEYLPDKFIDQAFSKFGIENLSSTETVTYCLADDKYRSGETDEIVVSTAGGNGVKTVLPGRFIMDDVAAVKRIRLAVSGACSVEIVLYAK